MVNLVQVKEQLYNIIWFILQHLKRERYCVDNLIHTKAKINGTLERSKGFPKLIKIVPFAQTGAFRVLERMRIHPSTNVA